MESNQTKSQEKSVIQQALSDCASFLQCYLPLANAHPVDFITQNVWDSVLPENIQEELCSLTKEDLYMLPSCYNICSDQASVPHAGSVVHSGEECKKHGESERGASKIVSEGESSSSGGKIKQHQWQHKSLADFLKALQEHLIENLECLRTSMYSLSTRLQEKEGGLESTAFVHSFMNEKKMHEVEIMADLCARIFNKSTADMVIDLGSGKGYLSTHLSLQFSLPVLGVDSQSHNTSGAVQRAEKLGRQWNSLKKYEEKKNQKKRSGGQTWLQLSGKSGLISESFQALELQNQSTNSKAGLSQYESDKLCAAVDSGNRTLETCSRSVCDGPTSQPLAASAPSAPSESSSESKSLEESQICKSKYANFVEHSQVTIEKTAVDASSCRNQADQSKPPGKNVAVTTFISPDTKLTDLILDSCSDTLSFKHADSIRLLLVGLHTCGPLASSMLQLFIKDDAVKAMCGVGCCYQLMQERFADRSGHWLDPRCHQSSGTALDQAEGDFPLSSMLLERKFSIGRTALNTASLALPRMAQTNGELQGKTFYPRALLQAFIHKKLGYIPPDLRKLRKLAKQASSPADYVIRALRKLNISGCEASEDEVAEFHEQHSHQEDKMAAFFQLKATLAPVVETVVLLDRLVYLMEQECVGDAFLIRLFDPVTSPRCHALIAFKKDHT